MSNATEGKVERYSPLANMASRTPSPKGPDEVKAFAVPPLSPLSKQAMKKSYILMKGHQIPVWVDMRTNIVFPCKK